MDDRDHYANKRVDAAGSLMAQLFRAAFTKPNMLDISGPAFLKPRMMTPQDMANDQMFLDAAAAKGGRIVKTEKGGKAVRRKKKIGIQIKGFGKARRG